MRSDALRIGGGVAFGFGREMDAIGRWQKTQPRLAEPRIKVENRIKLAADCSCLRDESNPITTSIRVGRPESFAPDESALLSPRARIHSPRRR